MRFQNKVAIITGAGQGLGAAYAKDFAKEGAKVVLVGQHNDNINNVKAEIEAKGGTAIAYKADISDYKQVEEMVKNTVDTFGTVDILINNAAVHKSVPIVETSPELWNWQINVNLNGTFNCSKAVLPIMMEKRYGKIINIASSAARFFFPGFGAYASSKGGMVSFTHTLSEEVKNYDINVNAIYLGMTNTEHTRARMNTDKAVTIPLEDMMQVDQVSKIILFLASDEAAPIMGSAIDVFGKKA
jgi:NAD(P)-dependent dehydrogenase (short-subunit alcohol dehydrogenase family)